MFQGVLFLCVPLHNIIYTMSLGGHFEVPIDCITDERCDFRVMFMSLLTIVLL